MKRTEDYSPSVPPPKRGIISHDDALEGKFIELENEIDHLYEHVPFGCHTLDTQGYFQRINSRSLSWLECRREEAINRFQFIDFLSAESREKYDLAFPRFVSLGYIENLELELVGKSGTKRHTALSGYAEKDSTGALLETRWVLFDITEHKAAEENLRIAAIVFDSLEGMVVTDANSVILRVNSGFTQLTGYSESEVVGKRPSLLHSGQQNAEFYQDMWDKLNRDGHWQGEIWNKRKNGELYAGWLAISPVSSVSGEISHYVGTFHEITKQKESEAAILRLAYYDPLTKLPNRTLLYDRLTYSMASSARTKNYGALLYLDLDNFKKLNDSLGHDVGDLILIEMANRLASLVRETDTVARLGGDEYVVVVDDLGSSITEVVHKATIVGEKILQEVARPFVHLDNEYFLTSSIGVSLYQDAEVSIQSLLKQSDLAMYQVKRSGNNAMQFFNPEMQSIQDKLLALESSLRSALKHGQLCLHYQPQIDNKQMVIGAEALVRWTHPERGLVFPGEFIPLAEETGLILSIGQWVLEAACAQIRSWANIPWACDLNISVNVSPRQFNHQDFIANVKRALEKTGADPRKLKIELTESTMLEDVELVVTRMKALKEIGITFSIDDFGTGFSSLSYLKRLPLDQLKIDQSFVQSIDIDSNDMAIVNTIISMGKTLGFGVIAEGVETEAQHALLDSLGCSAYQGYLISKPLPTSGFEQYCLHRFKATAQPMVATP